MSLNRLGKELAESVNASGRNTNTFLRDVVKIWSMPIEAKRDKAGGKLTVLTLNLPTYFITARFSVRIVTNFLYTGSNVPTAGSEPAVFRQHKYPRQY
jgi:hypothetical protein